MRFHCWNFCRVADSENCKSGCGIILTGHRCTIAPFSLWNLYLHSIWESSTTAPIASWIGIQQCLDEEYDHLEEVRGRSVWGAQRVKKRWSTGTTAPSWGVGSLVKQATDSAPVDWGHRSTQGLEYVFGSQFCEVLIPDLKSRFTWGDVIFHNWRSHHP